MNSNNNLKSAYFALAAASVLWGATGPIMKLTLTEIPVFTLAFLRFGIASIILFLFVRKKLNIQKKHLESLALSAVCGVTINITFFFLGLKMTSALNAGILIASIPLFTAFFAYLFLKEKIGKNIIIGAALGFIGIAVIIGRNAFKNGLSVSPFGDLLIILAILSFVAYEIISKRLFKIYDPIVITFYSFLIGAITFWPASLLEILENPYWNQNLSFFSTAGLIYGIFFSSLGAYCLWQWGLSKAQASRAGFFFYLDPIASTFMAVILLSEKITLPFILGSLLIFTGLFLAEGKFKYHPLHQFKLRLFKAVSG